MVVYCVLGIVNGWIQPIFLIVILSSTPGALKNMFYVSFEPPQYDIVFLEMKYL